MRARVFLVSIAAVIGCRSPQVDEREPLDGASAGARVDMGGQSAAPVVVEGFAGIEALVPRPWAAWPLENVDLVGFDGWRIDATHGGFERDHGLVFAAEAGAFVLAIADARVGEVARDEADRVTISLDHGHGIASHYGPLSDTLVHAGLPIQRGAAIGLAAGSSLQLRVTVDGLDIDPLLVIRQPLHRWPALLRSEP